MTPVTWNDALVLNFGPMDGVHQEFIGLLARAQAVGVAMTLHEAQDMIHVWPLLPIAQARPALATMAQRIAMPA